MDIYPEDLSDWPTAARRICAALGMVLPSPAAPLRIMNFGLRSKQPLPPALAPPPPPRPIQVCAAGLYLDPFLEAPSHRWHSGFAWTQFTYQPGGSDRIHTPTVSPTKAREIGGLIADDPWNGVQRLLQQLDEQVCFTSPKYNVPVTAELRSSFTPGWTP